MSLYKGRTVGFAELPRALACLPAAELGVPHTEALRLWEQWYAEGALNLGWVKSVGARPEKEIQCLGVSLWITDAAVDALAMPGEGSAAQRVYRHASRPSDKAPWVMTSRQIREANAEHKLNLLVTHFWALRSPFDPEFEQVYLQSFTLLRNQYQGYGSQWMLQEVVLPQAEILKGIGMRVIRADEALAAAPKALMGIHRSDASATSGGAMSFLFFSPKSRLGLRPSVQRMLSLALQQMTDEEIATRLGCSRDYVRNLWSDAYARLAQAAVFPDEGMSSAGRKRERRRLAVDFCQHNLQELRPGLPDMPKPSQ